jgi:hypothetical protein
MDDLTIDILAFLSNKGIGLTADLNKLYTEVISTKYKIQVVNFKEHLLHLHNLDMLSNVGFSLQTEELITGTDNIRAAITKYGYDTYSNFILVQSTLSTNSAVIKASKTQRKTFWIVLISAIATFFISLATVFISWLNYKETVNNETLQQRLYQLKEQIIKLQSETKKPISQKAYPPDSYLRYR